MKHALETKLGLTQVATCPQEQIGWNCSGESVLIAKRCTNESVELISGVVILW